MDDPLFKHGIALIVERNYFFTNYVHPYTQQLNLVAERVLKMRFLRVAVFSK